MTRSAVKFDGDKLPLHLLPFDALSAVAHIMAFGAEKYGDRNWEAGMSWHRLFRATLSHLWKWWLRLPADPETGRSHLWHAGCCILFLIAYELRGIGEDNRPVGLEGIADTLLEGALPVLGPVQTQEGDDAAD